MNYPYGGGVQPFYAPGGGGSGSGVSSIIAGSGISVDQATGAVTITNTGSAGTPAQATFANSSGNTTITPATNNVIDVGTITGAARTSAFILDVAGRADGDLLTLRFQQPATANIVEEVRNATASGTLLYSYTTDGSGTDVFVAELYFKTGAWHPLLNVQPVV